PKGVKRSKTQADEGLTTADEAGYVVLSQPPASKLANLFRIDVLSWSGHRSVLSWPWKESLRVHGIPPRSLSRSRPGCRRLVVIPTGILHFNRGKTGLTTQENECEKGKLRLRENRRSMDDRGMSLVPVDRRRSARPCCKSRAPRIRLTAQCPSPPRRAWWRAGQGQAPSDHPASPPNPGPKGLTTCGAPPESWPPRGGAY